MGDGALSRAKSGYAARYRLGHGRRQVAYADWKASLFANIGTSRSTNAKGAVSHDLPPLVELAELREAVYVAGRKVLSDDYLKQLSPLSLAVWYMDDGSFAVRAKGLQARTREGSGRSEICIEAIEATSRDRLVRYLGDTWGIFPKLIGRAGKAVLQFPKDETAKLHALVAPYVHPSMEYKLLPRFRGRFSVAPVFAPMRRVLIPMPIVDIREKPKTRSMHRFDIEVEGSHNYLVDGTVVHNSPETTPGGRALKFYSSVRLDVRKIENLKDGTEVVGSRTRVKVVKNKVAPPFRQCEFDIMYGKGISKEGSLLDVGVDLEIVKKSGAWFTYEGDQLGQGRENARQFLAEHLDVRDEIERKVREAVGLTAFDAGDDVPIVLGDEDVPPPEEPPVEEPAVNGRKGAKASG
jgi:recombination protein RecA